MGCKVTFDKYLYNIEQCKDYLDEEDVELFVETILNANRVFIIGEGITGIVAKAFAMRLIDLGLNSYFIPDNMSPNITNDDCIIAVSGSGENESVLNAVNIAKSQGATVLSLTSFPESKLNYYSDCGIIIMGLMKNDEENFVRKQLLLKNFKDAQLENDFELNAFIFFEGITFEILNNLNSDKFDMDDMLFEDGHKLARHGLLNSRI